MKKSIPNGFTMIDALLAMSISLVVAFLALITLQCAEHLATFPFYQQDQMAILQLREMIAVANAYEVDHQQLVYLWNHEERTILYDRHRLVIQKGYEIVMENIDEAYFYEKAEKIYLVYTKNGKTFTYQII